MIIETELWCENRTGDYDHLAGLDEEDRQRLMPDYDSDWIPGCINTEHVEMAHWTEAGEGEGVRVYFKSGKVAVCRMTWEEWRRQVVKGQHIFPLQ